MPITHICGVCINCFFLIAGGSVPMTRTYRCDVRNTERGIRNAVSLTRYLLKTCKAGFAAQSLPRKVRLGKVRLGS